MGVVVMINTGTERRKADRIKAEHLPDLLKKFRICLGKGDALIAQTLDISKKGIGLSVPVCIKDIDSIFITICTVDQSVMIKEQILSARTINETTSRINVMFTKHNPFFNYVN